MIYNDHSIISDSQFLGSTRSGRLVDWSKLLLRKAMRRNGGDELDEFSVDFASISLRKLDMTLRCESLAFVLVS